MESAKVSHQDVFKMYHRLAERVFQKRARVFTDALVCWLLILQHLSNSLTLRGATEALQDVEFKKLMGRCERTRSKSYKPSRNTSGISQAIKNAPVEKFKALLNALYQELSGGKELWHGREAIAIDGTTFTLHPSRELQRRYPPARNQHGVGQLPKLFALVLHNIQTGLALTPQSGAMFGQESTSEAKMAHEALYGLEPGKVIVGDRNFGIFSVVYHATKAGHECLFRLTTNRVQPLCGGRLPVADMKVRWSPTKSDREKNPGIPQDATVEGTVIVQKIQHEGGREEVLYLFSTIQNVERSEILELYRRRWELETDIRYLKVPMNLEELRSRTEAAMEKEFLAGLLAYNLVRAVMIIAGTIHGKDPKRLSFTWVLQCIKTVGLRMTYAKPKERQRLLTNLYEAAAAHTNPIDKRRGRPRQTYKRPRPFPPPKKMAMASF